MQAAHYMQLPRTFVIRLTGYINAFLDAPFIGFGMADSTIEPAKRAIRYANVGIVQVPVDVVVGKVSVQPFPNQVGKATNRNQIVRLKERTTIFKRNPLPGGDLFADLS